MKQITAHHQTSGWLYKHNILSKITQKSVQRTDEGDAGLFGVFEFPGCPQIIVDFKKFLFMPLLLV